MFWSTGRPSPPPLRVPVLLPFQERRGAKLKLSKAFKLFKLFKLFKPFKEFKVLKRFEEFKIGPAPSLQLSKPFLNSVSS